MQSAEASAPRPLSPSAPQPQAAKAPGQVLRMVSWSHEASPIGSPRNSKGGRTPTFCSAPTSPRPEKGALPGPCSQASCELTRAEPRVGASTSNSPADSGRRRIQSIPLGHSEGYRQARMSAERQAALRAQRRLAEFRKFLKQPRSRGQVASAEDSPSQRARSPERLERIESGCALNLYDEGAEQLGSLESSLRNSDAQPLNHSAHQPQASRFGRSSSDRGLLGSYSGLHNRAGRKNSGNKVLSGGALDSSVKKAHQVDTERLKLKLQDVERYRAEAQPLSPVRSKEGRELFILGSRDTVDQVLMVVCVIALTFTCVGVLLLDSTPQRLRG